MSAPVEQARELPFRDGNAGFSLILKRNCSISPAGLARVFTSLAVVVLVIGGGFALLGLWLVMPFSGLEVLVLGGAYLFYARRAGDYERIELRSGRLRVEVNEALKSAWYEFEAWGTRVQMEDERVLLRSGGRALELGRHLDAECRLALTRQLRRRLRN